MGWQCVNAVTYDFTQPGIYDIEAFEPNTFRYLKVMSDTFEGDVSGLFVRAYKNAGVKGATFQSTDPALDKIFAAAKETFAQNAVDAFTDCPSRERAGWLYDRPDCAEEARKVRETVLRQSWTGEWFCDNSVRQKDGTLKLSGECTETCQYYAFYFHLVSPETRPQLWSRLLKEFGPQRKQTRKYPQIAFANAFIGNYLRLELLSRAGRAQQILDETKGYFLGMAEKTGTLWEHDNTGNSCNHGFASHVAVTLVRDLLGVDVDRRTGKVTIRPTDATLQGAKLTLPTPTKTIEIDWKPNGKATVTNR